MNRKYLVLGISGLLVLILGIMLITGYNGLVKMDNNVEGKYAQIENRLQQRFELIGQILGAVSGLQQHSESIWTMITDARAAYASAKTLDELIAADAAQAIAFTSVLAVIEDNPQLINANSGYYALIDTISSIESQLAVARRDYNEAIQAYNTSVRLFPKVLYASLFGFERKLDYWKINDGTDEVPIIDFND